MKKYLITILCLILIIPVPVSAYQVVRRAIEPEALTYNARVQADGGIVVDSLDVNNTVKFLKYNSFWTNTLNLVAPQWGIKKDAVNAVSRLYCLKGAASDITQTIGFLQPTWTPNVQNGHPMLNNNGTGTMQVALVYGASLASYTYLTINKSASASGIFYDDYSGGPQLHSNRGTNLIGLYTTSGWQNISTSTLDGNSLIVWSVGTGNKGAVYKNGVNLITGGLSSGGRPSGNAALGCAVTGVAPYSGYIGTFGIFSGALSAQVSLKASAYFNSYWGMY